MYYLWSKYVLFNSQGVLTNIAKITNIPKENRGESSELNKGGMQMTFKTWVNHLEKNVGPKCILGQVDYKSCESNKVNGYICFSHKHKKRINMASEHPPKCVF